ncbi:MAG: hypothetical protein JWR69_3149, partial [Pedosphaera sp.]|nr:hypothetical protein [Pedosphaera sp.]
HPSLFENQGYKTLVRNALLWAAGEQATNRAGNKTESGTNSVAAHH